MIRHSTRASRASAAAAAPWRVSIKAQIKRLADLDVIPGDFATHLYKLYSAKGWSKEEPFDRHWAPGEPRVLRDALHLIVDEGVRSKSDLLALEFTIPAGDVENLTGLPPGWFTHEAAPVVKLKPNPVQSSAGEDGGSVVPFRRRD